MCICVCIMKYIKYGKNTASLHLYEGSKCVVKVTETESRMAFARGWGEREMGGCYPMGVEFQSRKMKTF